MTLASKQRKLYVSAQIKDIYQPGVTTIPSAPKSAVPTYSSVVLADSPVAFYLANESSGNLADSSGGGRSATANGTGTTYGVSTGRSGLATGVQLNGSGYFAVADSGSTLDPTTNLTYEIWWRFASNPGSDNMIMTKGFTSGNGAYGIIIASNGGIKINQDGVGGFLAAGAALSTGVLHHIVLTKSGSSVNVYVDGNSTPYSSSGSGFTPTDGSEPLTFGVASENGVIKFNSTGIMAGMALYNTALSTARITAHYNAGI